jgi:hypothetical protein
MRAVLAEEASGLLARMGLRGRAWIRGVPIYILLLGVFGVFLPLQKGRDFLDAVMLGAYACLGVVFAAPAASSGFETRPTIGRAVARVFVCVLYGELIAGVMLLLAVSTVYISRGGRIVVGPDLRSLAECLALGCALSLAVTTAAVWLSVTFSPRLARGVVRLIFLGLMAAFYFRSGWLPTVALRGAGIGLLAWLLFFTGLRGTLGTNRASAQFGRKEA